MSGSFVGDVPTSSGLTPADSDGEFYRSRIIIAGFAGAAASFGPVHTACGLADLTAKLWAAGWTVYGDLKLASVAGFRDRASNCAAICRLDVGEIDGSRAHG